MPDGHPASGFCLVPLQPTVGDISGNLAALRAAYAQARADGAAVVVFPELALCGYAPEDLLLRPAFVNACAAALAELAVETQGGPPLVLGAPVRVQAAPELAVYNAAVVLAEGRVAHVQPKQCLPNEGVFDEPRVFRPGTPQPPVLLAGVRTGLLVCEDVWHPGPATAQAAQGAQALLVLNASPYDHGKAARRRAVAQARVQETGLPLLYLNLLGGQDELVFDGDVFTVDATGTVHEAGGTFSPSPRRVAWNGAGWQVAATAITDAVHPTDRLASDYAAMMLGLREYVNKNGFPGVLLGLSGGIDSALTLQVAVDALGAARVRAVRLPSPYTAPDSLEDAAQQAGRISVPLDTMPIADLMDAYTHTLAPTLGGAPEGLTAENLQSRIRGGLLMALSNASGAMLLTTGNKSEMATGYATLYGDMCGGYSVLKDVYKTHVYALAAWRNAHVPAASRCPLTDVIPARVLHKAPTAELRPGQTDQDSLPPYATLDAILHGLIEGRQSAAELVQAGQDAAVVARVVGLLRRAEYKRRQSPPGVKLTPTAFGRDWRYPLTHGFAF